jgi:glycosyltransferase involved in cell wall biosynthesis
MTKILFLVTQSEMGGAQRYVFEIARSLDKQKYNILVAAGQGDGELFRKLEITGIRSLWLKEMKRAPWPWQIMRSWWEIRELLKKEKPDILFLCSTTAGLLGSLARISYKVKIIYRIGGWAFKDPRAFWKNWLILWVEKITAPLKDVIAVNSEIDRKLALKYRIVPENKLVEIYNGIDADSLNFLPREEALSRLNLGKFNEGKIVGTVANFYKTKGLEYLIEAAHNLVEAEPQSNIKFVIVGEGEERQRLESSTKKYGLENRVILAGRIPDAYRCLKAFDVFVLPSLKEGFPWIILEAIAAQVPIVATEVGAVPEILDEEFLVAPGNVQGLAKKIGWMIEHPTKAKLRPEFTLQKMISETQKLLARFQPPVVRAVR